MNTELQRRIDATDRRLKALRVVASRPGAPPSLQVSIASLEKQRAGLVEDLQRVEKGAA